MSNSEEESEVKTETTETVKMKTFFSFTNFNAQYLKNFFLFAVMGAGAGWVCRYAYQSMCLQYEFMDMCTYP